MSLKFERSYFLQLLFALNDMNLSVRSMNQRFDRSNQDRPLIGLRTGPVRISMLKTIIKQHFHLIEMIFYNLIKILHLTVWNSLSCNHGLMDGINLLIFVLHIYVVKSHI